MLVLVQVEYKNEWTENVLKIKPTNSFVSAFGLELRGGCDSDISSTIEISNGSSFWKR